MIYGFEGEKSKDGLGVLCNVELHHFLSLPDISRVIITRRKGQEKNIARMADSHEGIQAETHKKMDKLGRLDFDCSKILKCVLERNERDHIH
jgi:hypothetical protein